MFRKTTKTRVGTACSRIRPSWFKVSSIFSKGTWALTGRLVARRFWITRNRNVSHLEVAFQIRTGSLSTDGRLAGGRVEGLDEGESGACGASSEEGCDSEPDAGRWVVGTLWTGAGA